MDIQAQLTAYPFLSASDRARIDAYVLAHPDWKDAWEVALADRVLVEDHAALFREVPDDETLAYYLTLKDNPHTPPPIIERQLQHIAAYLEATPEARDRAAVLRARIQEAEAASADAAAQFEALIGRGPSEG